MAFSASAVANFFIDLAAEKGAELSPMKLQKLVYFAHGWHLAIYNEPLIDEQIEAWKYGPVIKSLYHEFKRFGNQPITEHATISDVRDVAGKLRFSQWEPSVEEESTSDSEVNGTKAFLRRVWDVYGGYSPVRLSNMTHMEKTPWWRVNSHYGGDPPKGTDIPQDWIKEYFAELAED